MRVLYVTTPRRTGAWLAEAFAGDSACQVAMDEAQGAAAGLARLRDQVFDAVLVSHEPPELDALELVDGLRAGGTEEPLIVLGQQSEQEMAALGYEVGADAYLCAHPATTRTLLWIVARATERHRLLRENRRMAQAERHRLQQEHREAERLLAEQRELGLSAAPRDGSLGDSLKAHYRELLRAHVIMGTGNLSGEMESLAELLAAAEFTAAETVQLHVDALEELVLGLGNRSARHVMTRADLLVLEILIHLAECYRQRGEGAGKAPVAERVADR